MQQQTQTATLKKTLRKQLRTARKALNVSQQQHAAKRVCQQLKAMPAVQQAKNIALYLSEDGEVCASDFIQWCWREDKAVYVPIVRAGNTLLFARYHLGSEMRQNQFAISEPIVNEDELIAPEQLDLVLMPLVGFDEKGNRLGMGGGFYDRTFEFLRKDTQSKPELIGLAHECQKVSELDVESWDIPLRTVVTDEAVYQF